MFINLISYWTGRTCALMALDIRCSTVSGSCWARSGFLPVLGTSVELFWILDAEKLLKSHCLLPFACMCAAINMQNFACDEFGGVQV